MMNLHGAAREIAINKMLAVEELKDHMVKTYGFEFPATIEFFQMCERHESLNILRRYVKLVDGAAAEDWFGFDF